MPTVEERLEALERARVAILADLQRVEDQIKALQQQLAVQTPSTDKKFEALMRVSVQHSSEMTVRFDALGTSLRQQLNTQSSKLQEQLNHQTAEIKEKFETSDHFAARTWGVVQAQEQDIRIIKGDVALIKGQIGEVKQDVNGLDVKFDRLEQLLLDRLPPPQ